MLGWIAQRLYGSKVVPNWAASALLVAAGLGTYVWSQGKISGDFDFWLAGGVWLGAIKGFGSAFALAGAAPHTDTK